MPDAVVARHLGAFAPWREMEFPARLLARTRAMTGERVHLQNKPPLSWRIPEMDWQGSERLS